MIVLGWTGAALVPDRIATRDWQGLKVLTLPEEQAATPRARLAHQVALFLDGVSFLPVAPQTRLTLDAALGLVSQALQDRLAALSGLAQMTLAMDPANPATGTLPVPAPADGRGYLAQRKARHDGAARIEADLADLAGALDPIETRPGPGCAHLLIPRHRVAELASGLPALAHRHLSTPGRLHVLGPWPPVAFADPPDLRTAA